MQNGNGFMQDLAARGPACRQSRLAASGVPQPDVRLSRRPACYLGALADARAALGGWPITRLNARLKEASES